MLAEGVDDLFGFPLAQQTVVDENAGQAVTDSPMDKRSGHGGIHVATQTADDATLFPNLGCDSFD
jgi:hypothetical protein